LRKAEDFPRKSFYIDFLSYWQPKLWQDFVVAIKATFMGFSCFKQLAESFPMPIMVKSGRGLSSNCNHFALPKPPTLPPTHNANKLQHICCIIAVIINEIYRPLGSHMLLV